MALSPTAKDYPRKMCLWYRLTFLFILVDLYLVSASAFLELSFTGGMAHGRAIERRKLILGDNTFIELALKNGNLLVL